MRAMWTVMRKELLDALRDRRSVATTLMYGLWGPLVMALALVALARDRDGDGTLVVAIAGREHAPSLAAFLQEQRVTVIQAPTDPVAAVHARAVPTVLVVDPTYGERFSRAQGAPVTLVFNSAWRASSARARRVRGLLEDYGRRVAGMRLVMRGIVPSIATPLRVEERDMSTVAERAGAALATLPIFLLVAAFVGGMNIAADISAGERERGSLEALLIAPVPNGILVAGKWATAAAASIATVALTLGVSAAVLKHPGIQALEVPLGLAPEEALNILGTLAPLAALAPALQILLALFASTYKEAQSQLSVLLFVPMLPGFLLAFGTFEPQRWMQLTPIVGQHLFVAGVLRGSPPAPAASLALAGITTAAAIVALAATAACLANERIVRGRV